MQFLDEEYYQGQKIIEQQIIKKKLFIITRDKFNRYILWCDDKKIATKNDPLELEERMK